MSDRRFGIEFEINAFDGKSRPDGNDGVAGIQEVGVLVSKYTTDGCEVRGYEHTEENERWVVKPDSSCGMEVCTPVYKGWAGLKKTIDVIYGFSKEPKIKADKRCSVHIHIEVIDLSKEQIASVIAMWMKCEPFFMDLVPLERKVNRYCQFMGFNNLVNLKDKVTPLEMIQKVGNVKYYSLNTNQYLKGNRKTLEFRIGESDGCTDPFMVKNWVRLLLHFVERTSQMAFPSPYKKDDPWSSFCWLDHSDVFKVLGFCPKEYELSPGLSQTRDWVIARLLKHINSYKNGFRKVAYDELMETLKSYEKEGLKIPSVEYLKPDPEALKKNLYHEQLQS